MGEFVLLLVGVLVVAAIIFGVAALISGDDPGVEGQEPEGRAVPLPGTRPLAESDLTAVRFDTALRGYRMSQVDAALRRAAYDIGYKEELIQVLQAEVVALREGRADEAERLRRARETAAGGMTSAVSLSDEAGERAEGTAGDGDTPPAADGVIDLDTSGSPADATDPADPALASPASQARTGQ